MYQEVDPTILMDEENPADSLGPTSRPDNGKWQPLVDHCMKLYETFDKSEYRAKKKEEIKMARLAYEQIPDPALIDWPWEGAYNIVMPLLTIAVDNLEPRLVAGLVGKDPILLFEMGSKIVPGVKPDDLKICENWYNGELKDSVKIEQVARGIVHTLLNEGTYYAVPRYRLEKTIRKDFLYNEQGQMVPHPITGLPSVREIEEVIADGGTIEAVPFDDVLCADNLGTMEEWENGDKIWIVRPTYGELMRSRGLLGYMPDMIGPWLIAEKMQRRMSEDEQTESQKVAGVEITGNETIRCGCFMITYYSKKDEEQDENEQTNFEEEKIVALIALDSQTVLRVVKLRDLNWRNESILKRIRLFPEEGRSYGTGFYGKIKGIQEGSTAFLNTSLNYGDLSMLPFYFYSTGEGPTTKKPVAPGEGVEVGDVQKILFPKFNTEPSTIFKWLEFLIAIYERVSSIANPQIGRPNDTAKTATEQLLVVQEGNIKFNYQAQTSKDEFVALLATLYDLYYQYMPLNKTFQWKGQQVQIPRPALRRNYSFSLTSSTESANKLIERKEAEDIYKMSANNPLANPLTAWEDLLKAYGKTDLKRYTAPGAGQLFQAIIQNPELKKVVGDYLATKQAVAQEVTGGPGGGPPRPQPKQLAGGMQ
jgi:hypothetical protein